MRFMRRSARKTDILFAEKCSRAQSPLVVTRVGIALRANPKLSAWW